MKKWKMDDYLKLLVILCAGSYVIRGTISLYFVATGMNICPAIALDGGGRKLDEKWYFKNQSPPCLSLLYLPAAFWLLSKSSKFIRKSWIHFIDCSRSWLHDCNNAGTVDDDLPTFLC